MKIEIKHYGTTYTVETQTDDYEITEMFDIFTGLLIQLGYQQQSINEAIKELADDL
jgi:Holliday junction resolvasome RuvABC DNA-binding subunit